MANTVFSLAEPDVEMTDTYFRRALEVQREKERGWREGMREERKILISLFLLLLLLLFLIFDLLIWFILDIPSIGAL